MKLPRELTTVTPLSKAVALLLFISLPILGFVLGQKYQKVMDETQLINYNFIRANQPHQELNISPTPIPIWQSNNNQRVTAVIGQEISLTFNRGVQAWYQDFTTKTTNDSVLKLISQNVDKDNIWHAHYTAIQKGTATIEVTMKSECPKNSSLCNPTPGTFVISVVVK